tara:strand:+ start:5418 stop:5654 length:237 start_codon:yes stop_codon:yes gene_type:complete
VLELFKEPRTWRTEYCFSLAEGITLCTSWGRDCIHFSDVRSLLKHLRQIKPTHDFKSEVWNYYGKNYTIKSTLKEEYL